LGIAVTSCATQRYGSVWTEFQYCNFALWLYFAFLVTRSLGPLSWVRTNYSFHLNVFRVLFVFLVIQYVVSNYVGSFSFQASFLHHLFFPCSFTSFRQSFDCLLFSFALPVSQPLGCFFLSFLGSSACTSS